MTDGPLPAFRALQNSGELRPDPAQGLAVKKLQGLHNALRGYRPASGMGGWKARFGLTRRTEEPPQGLYIYGPVGRGKSMLMDLFFETSTVEARRRVHFHEFMIEIHDFIHRWRKTRTEEGKEAGDPMPAAADFVAERARLLCFDEFRVTNIADAMILGRLFEALFERGVVVVATSNVALGDVYQGGLQRERFLPFIELFKRKLDLLALDSPIDYRMERLHGMRVYHQPLGPASAAALDKAFADLTEGARVGPQSFEVRGRMVTTTHAARGVARFSFAELCEKPLGAEDYLVIARRYHTIVLSGVPRMGEDERNEAHRFMTLIDELYEHRVKLVMSAEAPPEKLQSGTSHAFEFQRTVSRLAEMQLAEYLARATRANRDKEFPAPALLPGGELR
jgi:cell division protein ZapE